MDKKGQIFLLQVLHRFGFEATRKSDLVDARIKGEDHRTMEVI
jgi:hypothetical protein